MHTFSLFPSQLVLLPCCICIFFTASRLPAALPPLPALQQVLFMAEAGSYFGKRDIFRDHSKFVLSDAYVRHHVLAGRRLLLLTDHRVLLVKVGGWPVKWGSTQTHFVPVIMRC